MPYCKNPECRRILSAINRSPNDTAFCEECGELVWAFRPNLDHPDEWFAIGVPREGVVVDGDQCGGCGLNSFTLHQLSARLWVAVCSGQSWDDEDYAGCQTEHPVRQKMTKDVIF